MTILYERDADAERVISGQLGMLREGERCEFLRSWIRKILQETPDLHEGVLIALDLAKEHVSDHKFYEDLLTDMLTVNIAEQKYWLQRIVPSLGLARTCRRLGELFPLVDTDKLYVAIYNLAAYIKRGDRDGRSELVELLDKLRKRGFPIHSNFRPFLRSEAEQSNTARGVLQSIGREP